IGRSTQATVVNSTLQSVGDLTVGSPVKLTITAATGDVAGNGLGTFGGGLANQIRLSGSATTAPVVLSALGSDTNIGITLTPKGTGRVAVAANGLDVTGTLTATSTISNTAGGISITGNSTIVGQLTSLTGLTSSGTITFSGLTTGLVYNSSGVLSQVGNGTAGQVLMSNGASAPTFQALNAANVVVLASGTTTYTPSSRTLAIAIECVGAGGGGGGASGGSGTASVGGGGGAGGYSIGYLASPSGAYTIQIGAGGAGGNGSSGGNGTATWYRSSTGQCVANGGTGGFGPLVAGTTVTSNLGGPGGTAATCTPACKLNVAGAPGGPGIRWSGTLVNPGLGASSEFAGGGMVLSQGQTAGVAGGGCGAGASGAGSTST